MGCELSRTIMWIATTIHPISAKDIKSWIMYWTTHSTMQLTVSKHLEVISNSLPLVGIRYVQKNLGHSFYDWLLHDWILWNCWFWPIDIVDTLSLYDTPNNPRWLMIRFRTILWIIFVNCNNYSTRGRSTSPLKIWIIKCHLTQLFHYANIKVLGGGSN